LSQKPVNSDFSVIANSSTSLRKGWRDRINLWSLRRLPGRELRMTELSGNADAHHPMPITVRIHEACRLSGIGRSKLYELIAAGEIEIVKVGRITLVPMGSLAKFLQPRLG
jgi:excisionase family DNA binding protein